MSLISATRVVLSMRAAGKFLSANDRFVTKAFSVSSNLLAFDKSKLKYTDKHEWINEADGTVGITDYAQVNSPAISHLIFATIEVSNPKFRTKGQTWRGRLHRIALSGHQV